jgi:hypothetical protein
MLIKQQVYYQRRQLAVIALKTEFSRSEYEQYLANGLFEAGMTTTASIASLRLTEYMFS